MDSWQAVDDTLGMQATKLNTYRITKTFLTGNLEGITTKMTISGVDGPCRFRIGQVVKAIGSGTYRVDAIEQIA